METFSALQAKWVGNSPVPSEFPAQRPVTQSFDVFFDLGLNKSLSKQWQGRWFKTASHPLWRHCNAKNMFFHIMAYVPLGKNVRIAEESAIKLKCYQIWYLFIDVFGYQVW